MNGIPEDKYSICEDTGLRVCEILEGLQVREDGMIRKARGKGRRVRKQLLDWNCGTLGISNRSYSYYRIKIKNKTSKVHRFVAKAFLDSYSDDLQIDHIDGNPLNNNINNLRCVTNRQNQLNQFIHRNGKLPGACFVKGSGKWKAVLKVNKKKVHLGLFGTEQEAHEAYMKYKEENSLS